MDQLLVDVAADFAADRLEALVRVEARHVVELLGDNQDVFRGFGEGRHQADIGQKRHGSAADQQVASGNHRKYPLLGLIVMRTTALRLCR